MKVTNLVLTKGVRHEPIGMGKTKRVKCWRYQLKQAKIAMRELAVLDWPDKEEPTTKDLAPLAPLVAPFRDLSWRRRVG